MFPSRICKGKRKQGEKIVEGTGKGREKDCKAPLQDSPDLSERKREEFPSLSGGEKTEERLNPLSSFLGEGEKGGNR